MMITLLFPDFLLILIGFLLMRFARWGKSFWNSLEQLVYYILFPALLFYSTARIPFNLNANRQLLQLAMIMVFAGIALGWLGKLFFQTEPRVFESGVQTAFRFNAFVALAGASRLAGEEGGALMAIVIGFAVPINNVVAVWALAPKGHIWKEMLRNPLLLSTAGGALFNVLGLTLPDIAVVSLQRIGNASIAIGLIAVGAGLRIGGLYRAKALAGYLLSVKLLLLPALALLLGIWMALPLLHLQIIVMFCALPSASGAYVLTTRMGGDGAFVAFLLSSSTVLSAITMPLWLALTT